MAGALSFLGGYTVSMTFVSLAWDDQKLHSESGFILNVLGKMRTVFIRIWVEIFYKGLSNRGK